jgi:hypothetical protein
MYKGYFYRQPGNIQMTSGHITTPAITFILGILMELLGEFATTVNDLTTDNL